MGKLEMAVVRHIFNHCRNAIGFISFIPFPDDGFTHYICPTEVLKRSGFRQDDLIRRIQCCLQIAVYGFERE